MNPTAVFYGRVSTDKQSTEAQTAGARDYCALKHLDLSTELADEDISGSVPIWERPQGARLRKLIDGNLQRHLVVAKLDRLGRSASDLLATLKYLDSRNITLHILDVGGDSLSSQGPAGRLMLHILAAMAEFERELIRSRIQNKLDFKRDAGELCGTVPYGFDAVETGAVTPKGIKVRRLVPNDEEQKWIRMMQTMRQSGWSYHRIAQWLNAQSVPTKHARGEVMKLRRADGMEGDSRFVSGRWQCGNVAKVLSNKTTQEWLATTTATSSINNETNTHHQNLQRM